ncbi:hypothetical protein HPB52_022392 [Rhipicephalus sanguineus]|uniref:Uncharacterized protein n=1 Tax=Rhipicephalus sanguineus TaxID=34632 RepID=A0A9D4T2U1_RHISA|nr:hypothetical protein HPB52_022392 [Rhipicephalus sanguineus]
MRGYVATFLLATAVVLMVTLGLLVVVFLASRGDEKEHTSNDGLNKDISDLLERDAPAAEQNTDTLPVAIATDLRSLDLFYPAHHFPPFGERFCRNHNLMSDLVGNPTAKKTLDEMWSQRIHHYGQVNTPVMEASGNPLEYVTQSARGLQMISQLMRNKADSEGQPSYTILHYPMMYESMAAGVAKALTSYPVDILVAIGYTSYSDYGTKDCRMVPPVLHSEELLEPSLLNTSYPVRLACKKPSYKSAFKYDETFQAQFAYDKSENMLFTFDNSASIRYKVRMLGED